MELKTKLAIIEVRKRTLAPIVDCKKALELNSFDIDKSCRDIARARHNAKGNNRPHDTYGVVALYSYEFGRIGVMVELSCESGYVAKSHEFVKLANTIAIHIAWSNPRYIDRSQIDPIEIEIARDNFMDALSPPEIFDDKTFNERVIDRTMDRTFYPKLCLLDQPEMKETQGKKTIGVLIDKMIDKTGEKIVVKRFARFKIGEQ